MSEDFLYFIWQFQYFGHINLRTTEGDALQVIHPGYRNGHSGPDFTNARLLIAGVEWVGNVEMHCRTSDWVSHGHQHNPAYDNVILHIVWEADQTAPLRRQDGTQIPILALQSRTDAALFQRYESLLKESGTIPCARQYATVESLHRVALLDAVLLKRLERKAEVVEAIWTSVGQDWEETIYRHLATCFGLKINADPFGWLARLVPLKILQKHRDSLLQIEALLFGTAGLLPGPEVNDEYCLALRREYKFLSAKYRLKEHTVPASVWMWAKLRPSGFPTLRIAQFARLISATGSFSTELLGEQDVRRLTSLFQRPPSAYWLTHYRFGKESASVAAAPGEAVAHNLIINGVVPLLVSYARLRHEPQYLERALALLEALPAEDNQITRIWKPLGQTVRTAFDSQAVIELYNSYCREKRCLSCRVGIQLVR